MNKNGQQQYRADEIHTADSRKIILLLYEGAINFLNTARESAAANDTAGRAYNINRATAIVFELLHALDLERGGAIACNLRDLYIYILCTLMEANKANRPNLIADCITVLQYLLDGWKQAMFKPQIQINREQLPRLSYSLQI
jgi:flagellar protein FliS